MRVGVVHSRVPKLRVSPLALPPPLATCEVVASIGRLRGMDGEETTNS